MKKSLLACIAIAACCLGAASSASAQSPPVFGTGAVVVAQSAGGELRAKADLGKAVAADVDVSKPFTVADCIKLVRIHATHPNAIPAGTLANVCEAAQGRERLQRSVRGDVNPIGLRPVFWQTREPSGIGLR